MSRVGLPRQSIADTIQEAATHFINQSTHTQSPPTATIYRQALHLFIHFLTQHTSIHPHIDPISTLSLDSFQKFMQYLQATYSPETEHAYLRALRAFASTLTDPHLTNNLATQLDALTQSDRRKKYKQQIQLPSHDQITAIRNYLNHVNLPPPGNDQSAYCERLRILRDKALIFTLLDTGLKPSEIAALRVIHLQDNQVNLETIALMIPPQTAQAIRQYLSERAQLDKQQKNSSISMLPLFARHDKRAGSHTLAISRWTVANILAFWTKAATPPDATYEPASITPTTLRHHFVMSTLTSTNDLKLTQRQARHKDRATTRKYLFHPPQSESD